MSLFPSIGIEVPSDEPVAAPASATEDESSPTLTVQDSPQQESDGSISATLPRNTKVIITGNNRTKATLIGQAARTLRSVGLGGWHWLVLESGEQVRLQRNALTVVEYPSETQSEDSNQEHVELPDQECTVQDKLVAKKRDRRPTKPHSPTEYQQDMKRASPMAEDTRVNLHKLETSTLKRYRRTYKLTSVGPTSSREQLLQAVGHHFLTQTVDEFSVLATFAQTARRQHLQAAP